MTTPHANEHQLLSHRNERMPSWRRLAVIGAISSIALAGCTPADAEPKPVPAPSETVTPTEAPTKPIETPTPTPEPTPEAPELNNDPIPEALAYIENLSPEEVGHLPLSERLAYLSYVTRNVENFNYVANPFNVPEKTYPTEPITLDSDPQDFVTADVFTRLMSLIQETPEAGKRLLASSFLSGSESPTYAALASLIDGDDLPFYPLNPEQTTVMFETSKVLNASPVRVDDDGMYYRDITAIGTTVGGSETDSRILSTYYFVEFTDYKGEVKGSWIVE